MKYFVFDPYFLYLNCMIYTILCVNSKKTRARLTVLNTSWTWYLYIEEGTAVVLFQQLGLGEGGQWRKQTLNDF